MSGSYYALRRKMPAFKTYGFRKANQSEIDEINRRMMKPTASSQVSQLNLYNDGKDYQKRPRSACLATPCCAKHQFENQRTRVPKRVNERHINRIVRRLQTPTFSFEAHMADDRLDNLDFVLSKLPPRPRTASSRASSTGDESLTVQRLQRPTTATCLKRIGFCFYCDGEEEMKKYKRRQVQPLVGPKIKEEEKVIIPDDFNNEKTLTSTELEEVTKRVRTPTHASNGGTPVCKRLPEATTVTVYDSRSLPLASGLQRTNRIDDIVNRLYRPTYTMPICRHPANSQVR
ncbi:uncharacterized protein LOC135483908 [Lineus longissimus]|uniref:uncharacterized protein LOC135483908 n=1 Tax=Lineus longissimus TaxID=88925 RepID=UPI002B4EFC70